MPDDLSFRERFGGTSTPVLCVGIVAAVIALPKFVRADEKPSADRPLVRVEFTDAGHMRVLEGRILIESGDGGILLQGRDSRLSNVTPKQLKSSKKTGGPFRPFTSEELGQQLRSEFGEKFAVHTTKHYVVCSDAGPTYSKWCGALFERLMRAFRAKWKTGPLKLHDPEFPLPAIVFKSRSDFARYATADAGPAIAQGSGYYSIRTNRIVLYDLTGGAAVRNTDDVNTRLMKAASNVATVVHEATHQIAYNSGMHTRYADNPLWLVEGMAIYFETPDLRSKQGWRSAGQLHPGRLRQFRDYVAQRRTPDAITTLVSSNKRMAEAATAVDGYAEAWALTYFLIRTKRTAYQQYLSKIAKKPLLIWDTPATRLAEFKKAFGDDLQKLDRQFLRYMRRRRTR